MRGFGEPERLWYGGEGRVSSAGTGLRKGIVIRVEGAKRWTRIAPRGT